MNRSATFSKRKHRSAQPDEVRRADRERQAEQERGSSTSACLLPPPALNGAPNDMLELYCGNGNDTVSMSRHFDRVLGVERNAHLVQAAAWNIAINNCYSRALVITSPSEVFCSHVLSSRTYRHRPEHGTDGHIPSLGKGGQGGGGKGGGRGGAMGVRGW